MHFFRAGANKSRQARVQLRLALWLGTAVSCFPLAVYAGPHIAPYLRSQEQNTDHDVEMLAVDHRIDMMLALGQLDENFERVSNDDKERQHDLMRRYAEVCEREGRPRPELPVYTSPVGEDSELVAAVEGDNKA